MAKRDYTGGPIDMTQQHISERDLDEEAEDVEYATESEPAGEESVDFWPSSAPPAKELNETQVAIIEATADPTTEFESAAQLSREVVPEFSDTYASNVLWSHWPESDLTERDSGSSKRQGIEDPKTVDKIRRRLVDGDSSGVLADEFGVSKDVILNAAKELYAVYQRMPTQTEPVEYTGQSWSFVEESPPAEDETTADDDLRAEDESDVDDARGGGEGGKNPDDKPQLEGQYEPDLTSDTDSGLAADGGTNPSGASCVVVALTAVALWEVGRRVISWIK